MKFWLSSSLFLLLSTTSFFSAPQVIADDDPADEAIELLRLATTRQRSGLHNVMLRALRQMRDPALKPMFLEMSSSPEISMRIHGALGIAELSSEKTLDQDAYHMLPTGEAQVQLTVAALQSGLLNKESAEAFLDSPRLHMKAKVYLMAYLVGMGDESRVEQLRHATQVTEAQTRMIAWLLLMQLNDPQAEAGLLALKQQNALSRTRIVNSLLRLIIDNQFDNVDRFVAEYLDEIDQLPPQTQIDLIRAAAVCKIDGFDAIYRGVFQNTALMTSKLELALLTLAYPSILSEQTLGEYAREDYPPLANIFKTAIRLRITNNKESLILLEVGRLSTIDQWVIEQARLGADRTLDELLGKIIAALIKKEELSFNEVENLVYATELYTEHESESSPLIQAALEQADGLKQEAMLMGLIRSLAKDPSQGPRQIKQWKTPSAQAMATLLIARHSNTIEGETLRGLTKIIQDAGPLHAPLRVQAAWTYLRSTGKSSVALETALKRP